MRSVKDIFEVVSGEKGFLNKIKRVVFAILHTKDSADQVAGGVAVGLFMAFALPPGIQIVAALSVAVMLRRNAMAAVFCVFVSNPLTMPFIYPFAAYVGSLITGIPVRGAYPTSDRGFWLLATNFWMHGQIMILVMVGCFTLGGISSLIGYYVSKAFVLVYRAHFPRRQSAADKSGAAD